MQACRTRPSLFLHCSLLTRICRRGYAAPSICKQPFLCIFTGIFYAYRGIVKNGRSKRRSRIISYLSFRLRVVVRAVYSCLLSLLTRYDCWPYMVQPRRAQTTHSADLHTKFLVSLMISNFWPGINSSPVKPLICLILSTDA